MDSFTWIDGVTYTSSNNTATHTLTNISGCDSVVTLNLVLKTVLQALLEWLVLTQWFVQIILFLSVIGGI